MTPAASIHDFLIFLAVFHPAAVCPSLSVVFDPMPDAALQFWPHPGDGSDIAAPDDVEAEAASAHMTSLELLPCPSRPVVLGDRLNIVVAVLAFPGPPEEVGWSHTRTHTLMSGWWDLGENPPHRLFTVFQVPIIVHFPALPLISSSSLLRSARPMCCCSGSLHARPPQMIVTLPLQLPPLWINSGRSPRPNCSPARPWKPPATRRW